MRDLIAFDPESVGFSLTGRQGRCMTGTDSFDDVVTSPEALDTMLEAVLFAAARNDVNPMGSWVYRNDGDTPDLEVLITELEGEKGR